MFLVLAFAVALFIFVMGAWGVFAPGSIFAFISGWSSKSGFWLAVVLHFALASPSGSLRLRRDCRSYCERLAPLPS